MAEEADLGVDGGDHHLGLDLPAVDECDTDDLAVAHEHPLDRSVGAHPRPERFRGTTDRAGHAAHAAPGEAPGADLAVAHIADRVVQQDVGRARASGPAHVPMMPFTPMAPCMASVSNHSRARSGAPSWRRTTSELERTSSPLSRHTTFSWSIRSAGRFEPRRGGTCVSSGPSTRRSPSIRVPRSSASASAFEWRATPSCRPARSSSISKADPSSCGWYDGPSGSTSYPWRSRSRPFVIASGMRLITYDRAVTLKSGPHGVSVVAAPPTVDALEDDRSQPRSGQEAGGDESVVPAAHDDRVGPSRRSRRRICCGGVEGGRSG